MRSAGLIIFSTTSFNRSLMKQDWIIYSANFYWNIEKLEPHKL